MVSNVTRIPFTGMTLDRERPFFVGDENSLVQIVCHQLFLGTVDDAGTHQRWGPFVFCGATGSGKTHLLEGLAQNWQAVNDASECLMVSGADWARAFAHALHGGQLSQWRLRIRQVGMFVLDDLEQLEGKIAAQRELSSLLDDLQSSGRPCLISAHKNPRSINQLLTGLAGRLTAGLVIQLQTPGLQCRRAILEFLAMRQECRLTPMAAYALAQSSTNVTNLNRLLSHCRLFATNENPIIDTRTVTQARNSLAKTEVSMADICRAAARYFQVTNKQIRGRSRRRGVALARNIAIYLSREMTSSTLKEIGRYFGNRDHTTVMHSCRKMKRQMRTEAAISTPIEDLRSHLSKEEQW